MKREIIYPIFLECSLHATETFWTHIFEDMAYGKMPSGVYINNNFLCCGYKNKEFMYKIERKPIDIFYIEVYTLLHDKLDISSSEDKQRKKVEFSDYENIIKEQHKRWSDIKKKSIKDFLIEMFVVNSKIKYNLSVKCAQKLLVIITLALVFKAITAKDIEYNGTDITDINGIILYENGFDTLFDIYNITASDTVTKNEPYQKKYMCDNWYSYNK